LLFINLVRTFRSIMALVYWTLLLTIGFDAFLFHCHLYRTSSLLKVRKLRHGYSVAIGVIRLDLKYHLVTSFRILQELLVFDVARWFDLFNGACLCL